MGMATDVVDVKRFLKVSQMFSWITPFLSFLPVISYNRVKLFLDLCVIGVATAAINAEHF